MNATLKIENAIQQKKFRSEFHKAQVNLLYTAAWINQQSTQALKPYNISVQQFNILRILRGMRPEPATVKLLTERMIDKMSNASRLVEKLYQKGLVNRKSCQFDRRRVDIMITEAGLALLEEASQAMEEATLQQMQYLEEDEVQILNLFLDRIRTEE
jgi:DNA-binding MarR family transcriptional regulator